MRLIKKTNFATEVLLLKKFEKFVLYVLCNQPKTQTHRYQQVLAPTATEGHFYEIGTFLI